jgi:hypothetical protein
MSVNTERLKHRLLNLENCFHPSAMESCWQKIVKNGMRKQEFLDLHDYYDFHKNRKTLIPIIREQIVAGIYSPKPPQIIRKEKKYGVCRHIQIPTPDDALVLQTLVEKLAPTLLKAQPSKRSYYSRSHSSPKSESEIDETFSYEWWQLWPEFQEKIYEFSKVFKYIVVTDIANYYDNVSFAGLRNVISGYGNFDEELLDFLFFMLEAFVWRPDYLPLSGFGLPQVNFDAPRLLGHSFLFEIDRYLKQQTNDNFVRWMDDIDFGVNTIQEGKRILRNLDELLLMRGLRLNMGKTKILSSEEAKHYFLAAENRYLTHLDKRINRRIDQGKDLKDDIEKAKNRFRKFLEKDRSGRWGKVYKRYFTLAGKTNSTFLESYTPEILRNSPGIRDSAFLYYSRLGYSRKRFKHLLDFFLTHDCSCDVTVFSVVKVLTAWEIPSKSKAISEVIDAAKTRVRQFPSSADFIAALWLLAKYSAANELFSEIWSHRSLWESSDFASRQVACVTPLLQQEKEHSQEIERIFIEAGRLQAIRVMNNINLLRSSNNITSNNNPLNMYLTQKNSGVYPLSKFLILIAILQSHETSLGSRMSLKEDVVVKAITDQIYIKTLQGLKM